MNTTLRTRLTRSFTLAVLLFIFSVVGYRIIEDYSFTEAVYMTVITLSTVGFGEVQPLSPVGRFFTAGVILAGVVIIAILFSTLTEYLIAGELAGTLRKRRTMKKIDALKNHYIICGFGRVGEQVWRELSTLGRPCVIIENDPEAIAKCIDLKALTIQGDATEDAILRSAGIDKAGGLVSVLNTDAENVFVVLSARSLNADLTIVSRAVSPESEIKLQKAGADRIVSPYTMAGHRIVNQLTRPNVTYFIDNVMQSKGLEIWLEELHVKPESKLVGLSMLKAEIRTRTGANVLSILRGPDQQVLDWDPDLTIQANDTLIAVGTPKEIIALSKLTLDTRFDHIAP